MVAHSWTRDMWPGGAGGKKKKVKVGGWTAGVPVAPRAATLIDGCA